MNSLRQIERKLAADPDLRKRIAQRFNPLGFLAPSLADDPAKFIVSDRAHRMAPDIPRCVVCGAVTRFFAR